MISSKISDNFRIIKIHLFNFMEKNSGIGSENLNVNNEGRYAQGEIEKFVKDLVGNSEKLQGDDFGFAKREREENEAAELREKLKEMAKNTPEEDKKFLREKLSKEEAERLEKTENEQIEKEANHFEIYTDRERYMVFKKAGLIKNIEQYRTDKELFKNRSANNFKLFIDFYKINTSEKFKKFLDNKNNLEVLSKGKEQKIEFMFEFFSPEQFQMLIKEERSRQFLETGNQDVLRDYLEFNKIKNSEIIQEIFKDNKLDYILFSESKPENSKYIFSNFIKNQEDIKKAFEKGELIETLIKSANRDNFKHVVELYQINTLDSLKNFCSYLDAGVRDVLEEGNLENLREFTRLCASPEEFKKACNEFHVGYGLSKIKPKDFSRLIESGIIDKNNLFYFRSDFINHINSFININENKEDGFAFLKKIKDRYPNNVYNTLRAIQGYQDKNQDKIDIERDEECIFEILDKLGVFTAVIYEKIKKLNKEERNNYGENTKRKIEQIKEKYGFKDINETEFYILADFVAELAESDFKILCSDEVLKKIGKLRNETDLNKNTEIKFLARMKDNLFLKGFLEDKIVFSEVKGMPLSELYGSNNINSGEPTLFGRERRSRLKNINDYATFGRGDRSPYIGWEYIAAARSGKEADINKKFMESADINEKSSFEKAKEKLEYVMKYLPVTLKTRLGKVFETLDSWGKEGMEIEKKYQGELVAGSYVKFDDNININQSFDKKIDFPPKKYNEIYDSLDKSFKSASWVSIRIGKGVEGLYDFMIDNKKQFETEARNLEYLSLHQKELSEDELKILKGKSRNILNSLELVESIYNTPRGVYLSAPPLHGGTRGEDAKDWMPRSYALRDRVYYKTKILGKEKFINVKEYHLEKTWIGEQDDLKIRLYSFSDEADQKKLSQLGIT